MALATVVNWVDARQISRTKTTLNLREAGQSFYNINEITEEIILEFNGATLAAVESIIDANAQPAGSTNTDKKTYSYSYDRDDIVTGSYTIKRTYTRKQITFA